MKKILEISFLLSLFSLFMLSCASNYTKQNGGAVTDTDVKAMFENYEYVSNYNYFYITNWRDNSLEAIVGIEIDYVLEKDSSGLNNTNWQQFEPAIEKLKELVEAMDNTASYGFIIYAPGGEDQIGVMYIQKRFIGVDIPEIRFKDGNLIAVAPHKFAATGFSGGP